VEESPGKPRKSDSKTKEGDKETKPEIGFFRSLVPFAPTIIGWLFTW